MDYEVAAVNGKLSNNLLFCGSVLDYYLKLWHGNLFLKIVLLSLDSLFCAEEFQR